MHPPKETQGYTLAESEVREKYGVTIVGVKSPGRDFTYARPETKVAAHDLLIVSGHTDLIERFANRP
jgi:trk system potassium uptake protein TrkA